MGTTAVASAAGIHASHEAQAHHPAYQAYQILHWGFVAAPVIAGADKFLHLLTNWDQYLSPAFAHLSPLGAHASMEVVGVIEIVVGLVVALRPRVGAYVVAAWLAGIILDLLLLGSLFDVALRDFGLLLGALALGRLATVYDSSHGDDRESHDVAAAK
ncbi:MAG: hypothetical protein ACRENE_25525 [Polyangiaceae bacterium]